MAFFGFDTTLPRDRSAGGNRGLFEQRNQFADLQKAAKLNAFQSQKDEILDFEDTYDGLGDELEETGDNLNDETFGGGLDAAGAGGSVGRDFDFYGSTAQVSNAIDEEAMKYGIQHTSKQVMQQPSHQPKYTGYEQYNDPNYIPEIQARSGLFGTKSQKQPILTTRPAEDTVMDSRISTARPGAPKPQRQAMMSLEEVEASMRAHGQPQSVLPQQMQHQLPSRQMHPHMEHIPDRTRPQERQHVRMPSQPEPPLQIWQHPSGPPPPMESSHVVPPYPQNQAVQMPMMPPPHSTAAPVITHPQQLMQLSEAQREAYLQEDAKRAKRNHKIFLLSRGNGLMTPSDKNFITRIQLQQLVAATGTSAESDYETAMAEDFYCQVYSQIRGVPRQHPTQPVGNFAQTYLFQTGGRLNNRRNPLNGDNHMQRMQQQVQRAVEAAKAKPKNKQLIIEGSLGKISFSNAKTPKPLLNIQKQAASSSRPTTTGKGPENSPSDRRSILRNIETVYSTLITVEDHERNMPQPPSEQSPSSEAETAQIAWREKFSDLNKQLWSALKIMEPINPSSPTLHPFIAFLAFTKGKKAIRRIFRLIDSEQRVTILTMIIVHLDSLDVIRDALPSTFAPGESQPRPAVRREIDAFQQHVVPSILEYLADAPMNIMNGLLQLVLDHTNVLNVAQTRVGLSILSMLLSSAELIKQTQPQNVGEADWAQWQHHFSRLFALLTPHFPHLFLAPVANGMVDDQYVWQFLASVGIGASPEQQQRLVLSVKDRVMDTVRVAKGLPDPEMRNVRLGNVNLFMKGLGLDVSMLG